MKVLLIHNYYQYRGGEETYVTSLQRLLTKNGHTVILYSKDSKHIKTVWDKIKVGFGLFWNPKVAKELDEIIQKERPNVAHFNNIYPLIGATAYYICKKNNIKIVQTIHNYRFMCPKGILFRNGKICELCINKRFFLPAILFRCYHRSRFASLFYTLAFFFHKFLGAFLKVNIFIFPSLFTQQYYEKHFRVPQTKSVYLPHFVDLKAPKNKVKKEGYYLYVGRLSEEKGIIQLLELFKKNPSNILKVIGSGPLQKKVNIYRKYQNIHIYKSMDRIKILKYYRKAKALINSSLTYEVFHLTALEAISQNTQVLSLFKSASNQKTILITSNDYIQKLRTIYHV